MFVYYITRCLKVFSKVQGKGNMTLGVGIDRAGST